MHLRRLMCRARPPLRAGSVRMSGAAARRRIRRPSQSPAVFSRVRRACPTADICANRSAEGATTQAGQADGPMWPSSSCTVGWIGCTSVIASPLDQQIEPLLELHTAVRAGLDMQHPLAGLQINPGDIGAPLADELGPHVIGCRSGPAYQNLQV